MSFHILWVVLYQTTNVWPSITVIVTIAYLVRFLRFQRGPVYKPATSAPRGFSALPYPLITRDQQLAINIQLEVFQRVAIAAVVCVQTIVIFVLSMTVVWTRHNIAFMNITTQLICGTIRSLTLAAAWLLFLNQRRSSRPATHADHSLWLYRLSLRSSIHLEFWLVHTCLALVELMVLALQYGLYHQESSASVWFLGQAALYAIPCVFIAGRLVHFHRCHMVPILGGLVAGLVSRTPARLAAKFHQRFPDLYVLDSAYWPAYLTIPHLPTGVSWSSSVPLGRDIKLHTIKKGLADLSYITYRDFGSVTDEDVIEANSESSMSEVTFLIREIKTYSVMLAQLFRNWQVYSGILLLLLVEFGREFVRHVQRQNHRRFHKSVVNGTSTISNFMLYYYIPSQVISNIVPTLFQRLEARFSRKMHTQWKNHVYSQIQDLHQQSSKSIEDPEYFFYSYLSLAITFRRQLISFIGSMIGSAFLLTGMWKSIGPEAAFLGLTYLLLVGFIDYGCRLVNETVDPHWYLTQYGFQRGIQYSVRYMARFKRLFSEQYEYQQLSNALPAHLRVSGTRSHIYSATYTSLIYRALYYPWIALCVWKFHAGGMSQVECIFAMNAYRLITSEAGGLAHFIISRFKPSNAGMSAVKNVNRAPDLQDDVNAPPLHLEGGGSIEFHNVSFAYGDQLPIFHNLNLCIPAGRTTAIVGVSGQGKSTLLNLIMRMVDVTEGAILIDGQDIRRVAQSHLRGQIAYVNQTFVTFPGSIYYNIAYGTVSQGKLASKDDVIEATKAVNLYDTILKRKGDFEFRLNPYTRAMSGGELQRLGIARALVKKAPILLLDEATAALDSPTETRIMDHLRHSAHARTTVIIAHRLSTIMDADQIVVLDHGRVAELGTHAELVAKGGIYATMWTKTHISDKPNVSAKVDEAIKL